MKDTQDLVTQVKEMSDNVLDVKKCILDLVKMVKPLKKLDPNTVRELGGHITRFGDNCVKFSDLIELARKTFRDEELKKVGVNK